MPEQCFSTNKRRLSAFYIFDWQKPCSVTGRNGDLDINPPGMHSIIEILDDKNDMIDRMLEYSIWPGMWSRRKWATPWEYHIILGFNSYTIYWHTITCVCRLFHLPESSWIEASKQFVSHRRKITLSPTEPTVDCANRMLIAWHMYQNHGNHECDLTKMMGLIDLHISTYNSGVWLCIRD